MTSTQMHASTVASLCGAVATALLLTGLHDLRPIAAAGPVQEPFAAIFVDDFETDSGWTANPHGTDTASAGAWERAALLPVNGISLQAGLAASGRHALVTGSLPATATAGANDVGGGITSIASPEIVLPDAGGLTLTFSLHFAHLDASPDDFFRASVIGPGGVTPILTLSAADGIAPGAWVKHSASLDAFAGQIVRVLFEAADLGRASLVEAAIDDVIVTSGEEVRSTRPLALGSNLALNRPATGSTPCNANEGPAKAVNGSVSGGNSDKWCSLAATKFLQVDLGASLSVSTFIIKHASAGGESASFNTRAFTLQVSTNGTSFSTVVNVTSNTAGTTTHTIATRTARFVRLNVTTPQQTAGGAARIYELEVYSGTPDVPPPPSSTWQEHWFEHNQLLTLARFNDAAAIYVDADVDPAQTAWLLQFVTQVWQYTKQTYGAFGADPRMHSIHHQGRYFGGHPGTYLSDLHDFRNSSDIGVNSWAPSGGNRDLISHEIGHVVEGANNGIRESPAFTVWGDSKWAEFYQYDLYVALGMTADADRVFTQFSNAVDNFPAPGTRWFRDWFHPLWRDHGRAQVMVRFFGLLAQHFPKQNMVYTRRMNLGELIHFMSGAAGADLSSLATTAFGTGWEAQFQQARQTFPAITY